MRQFTQLSVCLLLLASASSSLTGQFLSYGTGCSGTAGTPRLEFEDQNLTGSVTFATRGLSTGGTAALLVGFTKFQPGIDLSAIGMTGCSLYHDAVVSLPMFLFPGTGLASLDLDGAQPCDEFYIQAAQIDFGANALGVVTSNAATIRLDPAAETFRHIAVLSNTGSNSTFLDEPSINDEPNAVFLFTSTWNGRNNLAPNGLWYSTSNGGRWAIFRQDQNVMPLDPGFHVFLPNSAATQFVVTVDSANIVGNSVEIDHPSCNGDPNAMLFVNQRWNLDGVQSGVYNDSEIGVLYSSSAGRWRVYNIESVPMPMGASFNVVIADENLHTSVPPFRHTATAANAQYNTTEIDRPGLNGNPDAQLIITQTLGNNVRNPHAIDSYYSAGRWNIRNQNGSTVQPGATFNVLIGESQPRTGGQLHSANSGNTMGQSTRLNNPFMHGDPSAIAIVTQRWNPYGTGGVYNPHPIGVYFGSPNWYVFNENRAAMPDLASFNIYVPNSGATKFIATKPASPSSSNVCVIDHPSLNGNPTAMVFVTQNWNPNGSFPGVYNDSPVGVWYNGARWTVFNEDGAVMNPGSAFNVLVADERLNVRQRPFSHRATSSNTTNHITVLDHPSLNGQPHAFVTVTQSWRNGVYNPHEIGVFYASGRWRIFNQDFASIPNDATFNVLIGSGCR